MPNKSTGKVASGGRKNIMGVGRGICVDRVISRCIDRIKPPKNESGQEGDRTPAAGGTRWPHPGHFLE